jgi:hypothetical protein
MRANSIRRLASGAAALALAGATILSTAGIATAAPPPASVTTEALPPRVTGDTVGFRSTFTYDAANTSTLSKVFVTVFTHEVGANGFWAARKNGSPVANACVVGTNVSCTFKSVRPGDQLSVTVAYARVAALSTVNIIWSSTGSPTSDVPGASHGDTWQDTSDPTTATFGTNDGDYAGGFFIAGGLTVGNSRSLSVSNTQSTKIVNIPAGVAATVSDAAGTSFGCGNIDCSSAFGNWSIVTVGDGQRFDSTFQIVIAYYSGTPRAFVHEFVDSFGVVQHELVETCAKKSPTLPCFTWSARTNEATIYTNYNGSFRGL